MGYISGGSKQLLELLEEAFEIGFHSGFVHVSEYGFCTELNPEDYEKSWEAYKSSSLRHLEDNEDEDYL